METKDAWETVEAGGVVNQAFVNTSPTVEALRAELAHGPARASWTSHGNRLERRQI